MLDPDTLAQLSPPDTLTGRHLVALHHMTTSNRKEPTVKTYIVTGSYMTMSGNFGAFRYELRADDSSTAFDLAHDRLVADKRRRYWCRLSMSACEA
ncbi:MAG: hypothetical protein ACK5VE_03750 [Alphaproteobacteria bacterium]|jgi:hypothetical protein